MAERKGEYSDRAIGHPEGGKSTTGSMENRTDSRGDARRRSACAERNGENRKFHSQAANTEALHRAYRIC